MPPTLEGIFMRIAALAFAAAGLFAALPAAAEPYKLDKSHATVIFTVGHLGFSTGFSAPLTPTSTLTRTAWKPRR
jgi:polyisoprenoid-binding protein YceI